MVGAGLRRGINFLGINSWLGNNSGAKQVDKNMGNTSMRIPLQRIVQSIQNWRDAINEMEYYIPFRVKNQQLFNDLIDETHISAAIERRMDLTLQRDFILDCGNDSDTEFWTNYLKEASWFINYERMVLTALFRGYTLISIGNIVTDPNKGLVNALPELKMLEHSLISPDRRNFASVVYSVAGQLWDDPEYSDWHIYVDTPTEIGNGCCGYGLLNKIAVPGIILRNNLSDWANFNEVYGQPVRWGKTNKQEQERVDFFNNLKAQGASATYVTDHDDDIDFIPAGGNGQGFKSFEQLKSNCEKLISKRLLGHADVLDSIAKKSGATSGGSAQPGNEQSNTPVQEALSDIASKDGKFVTPYIEQLINLLRKHGVGIPKNAKFSYTNDAEEELTKQKEYSNYEQVAAVANSMKLGGLQMDAAWFTKETGIPCSIPEPPEPTRIPTDKNPEPIDPKIKNKLNRIYNRKKAP